MLKFLERLTGVHMLADLSEFLLAFSGLFEGFRERSHQVQRLMREPGTNFLLVCAPEPASLRQVDQFAARLGSERLRVAGVLANRVNVDPRGDGDALVLSDADRARLDAAAAPGFSPAPLSQRVLDSVADATALAQADRRALDGLRARGFAVHEVASFAEAVSGMDDLLAFATRLEPDADR